MRSEESRMKNEESRMIEDKFLEQYLAGKAPLHANRLKLPTEEELDEAEAAFDSLTPRPLQGERELKRRRLWPWIGAIAASIVIAFILWPNSPAVIEQQPVVAEVVEQPAPEASEASDYSESSEYSDYSDYSDNSDKSEPSKTTKPIKPKRSHKSLPKEEPLLAQADPLPEEPVISTQAEEPVVEYQSVQTIRVAPDQVVFNVQTADMPMMANMPSVGELRARGQQLLANVQQQISEASKQF